MATCRYVHIDHREGGLLRDLTSIRRDFVRCQGMCKRIYNALCNENEDLEWIDAFATAIAIIYGRPFNGGMRCKVDDIIQTYDEAERMHHESMMHLRSKHAAHSVNSMEIQRVRIWLRPEEHGRGIQDVNADITVMVSLTPENYQRLGLMCERAISWVTTRISEEEQRLRDLFSGEFTLDEVYSMQADIQTCGGLESAGKGRKQR